MTRTTDTEPMTRESSGVRVRVISLTVKEAWLALILLAVIALELAAVLVLLWTAPTYVLVR